MRVFVCVCARAPKTEDAVAITRPNAVPDPSTVLGGYCNRDGRSEEACVLTQG